MKYSLRIKTICLLLVGALLLPLTGCAAGPNAPANPVAENPSAAVNTPQVQNLSVNLMQDVTPNSVEAKTITPEASSAVADFALRLFRAANEADKNTLVSPLSVLCALAMTANGAENETLTQMESTLGLRRDLYNEFFRSYLAALNADGTLKAANSIWFTDRTGFEVKPDFLQANADYYGADAYLAPFDETTLAEINGWVKEKTDGMIPEILDKIPDDAVMYLINALAFDAKWARPYNEYSVQQGTFTTQDGAERTVDFMHSEEKAYLEDDSATGFVKYYEGFKFAFVALLPNEGVSVADYLATLDGASLQKLLSEPRYDTVYAALPKFETEYSVELSETLKAMGMELPFDADHADFSGIGTSQIGDLCIGRVLHKTYISVAEDGTRAGAATAVEVTEECAAMEEPKYVMLDRPFVYMLIDCETNLPFFIGTMLDPAA